jgi:hypothetical protein
VVVVSALAWVLLLPRAAMIVHPFPGLV